ncbi:hypothetical protein DRQ12_08115 [candidate division KSB1 bacterium]|nr:MAG: hypothetical protein DRQ12_08115 [candidate division KSB1 bacterium]
MLPPVGVLADYPAPTPGEYNHDLFQDFDVCVERVQGIRFRKHFTIKLHFYMRLLWFFVTTFFFKSTVNANNDYS